MPLPSRILLGVTGGVAAYKACELARLLVKAGATVQVVMTDAAREFVGPATFQALTSQPVLTSLWDTEAANGMDHIAAARAADLILIAPATADFLARLAAGRADDLLSTLCLARVCPLMVAPAMNREMWDKPATRRNVQQLIADGVRVLGPATGEQACGETGLGRMLEAVEILAALDAPGALAGRRVVVTAGPTFEAIDPVRGLTNSSSGRMGYALAAAARAAGAEVVLVSGPTALATPTGVTRVDVTSARAMHAAVFAALPADIFIAVAAVADYRPASPAEHKLKKSDAALTLELVPNPDILLDVAALPEPPFCVGFAAETENLASNAEAKRLRKKLPLMVGNLAQHTLGAPDAELVLFDDAGQHPLPRADKAAQARAILEHLMNLLPPTRPLP